MIKKEELIRLHHNQGKAVLSIVAPLTQVYPGSNMNQILMKNMLKEAEIKLNAYYDNSEVQRLLEKVTNLESGIDLLHPRTGGIAIYVSDNTSEAVALPHVPLANVCVRDTFETRELVKAFYGTHKYLLCAVSNHHTNVYRGFGHEIKEVHTDKFPLALSGPSRTEALTSDRRANIDNEKLEDSRIAVREVGDALFELVKNEKTPLFVIGEAEAISFLRKHTRAGRFISGEANDNESFNFDKPDEILKKVYPIIEDYFALRVAKKMTELKEMVGFGRAASGIQDVWQAARKGQVMTLMVEENFHQPASLGKTEIELTLEEGTIGSAQYEDAVDEIIAQVIETDGEIVFLSDSDLKDHNSIAAILRYAE